MKADCANRCHHRELCEYSVGEELNSRLAGVWEVFWEKTIYFSVIGSLGVLLGSLMQLHWIMDGKASAEMAHLHDW